MPKARRTVSSLFLASDSTVFISSWGVKTAYRNILLTELGPAGSLNRSICSMRCFISRVESGILSPPSDRYEPFGSCCAGAPPSCACLLRARRIS